MGELARSDPELVPQCSQVMLRDLLRTIRGLPGKVKIGCGSMWDDRNWQLRAILIVTVLFFVSFCSIVVFLYYSFIFIYFFFFMLLFVIYILFCFTFYFTSFYGSFSLFLIFCFYHLFELYSVIFHFYIFFCFVFCCCFLLSISSDFILFFLLLICCCFVFLTFVFIVHFWLGVYLLVYSLLFFFFFLLSVCAVHGVSLCVFVSLVLLLPFVLGDLSVSFLSLFFFNDYFLPLPCSDAFGALQRSGLSLWAVRASARPWDQQSPSTRTTINKEISQRFPYQYQDIASCNWQQVPLHASHQSTSLDRNKIPHINRQAA